jgi:hypothetical protein
MVDQALLPAITLTIRRNEIGNGSPYVLSFARLGKSGASFGFMQGDTNVSALARDTLGRALAAGGVDAATAQRIVTALSRALPGGNPLDSADTTLADDALASAGGRAVVDAMDQELFQVVTRGLDSCIAAAATRALAIAPLAVLYIAPWINMSGAPTLLNAWLRGAAVHGVPAPSAPTVTADDVIAYLQATAYFQAHPRNFSHLEACVQAGEARLPAG